MTRQEEYAIIEVQIKWYKGFLGATLKVMKELGTIEKLETSRVAREASNGLKGRASVRSSAFSQVLVPPPPPCERSARERLGATFKAARMSVGTPYIKGVACAAC